jgi:hypothetical protein
LAGDGGLFQQRQEAFQANRFSGTGELSDNIHGNQTPKTQEAYFPGKKPYQTEHKKHYRTLLRGFKRLFLTLLLASKRNPKQPSRSAYPAVPK